MDISIFVIFVYTLLYIRNISLVGFRIIWVGNWTYIGVD